MNLKALKTYCFTDNCKQSGKRGADGYVLRPVKMVCITNERCQLF